MPASATSLGCLPGVDQTHHTASLCRFAREVLDQVAPGGVQDAFCQMPVPHQVCDAQVFERDSVVTCDERLRQLVQEALTRVGDLLVLALKLKHRLTSVAAALLPTSHSSLKDTQLPLCC